MQALSFLKLLIFRPKIKGRKWCDNLWLTLLFVIMVYLPDFILKCICGFPIRIELVFFLGTILFGFLFSLTNKIVFFFFAVLILIMQLIQLHFMVYFGMPIDPANIMNMFREAQDVFDITYLKHTWFVAPTLFMCFFVMAYAFCKLKPIKLPLVWVVIFYLAAHKPYSAYAQTKGIWFFQPALTRPSLKNSISTFSYFVFQYWPKGYENLAISYKPYTLKKIDSDVQNILLIWGESLYAGHLPMYGYERQTFPLMTNLLSEDGWKTSLGISNGTGTATSTLLFFNVAREPANAEVLQKHTANLFKAAKMNGFKTYYLSIQESCLTMGMDVTSIDEVMTKDVNPIYFAKYRDEGLIKLLEKYDLSKGKNFVVLHMKSPHSPYENRYKGREDEFEKFKPAFKAKDEATYRTNTYDNALLYADTVMFSMVKVFEKLVQNTNYSIFISADHGELFDYNGIWGHNHLVLEQAKVPVFVKSKRIASLEPVLPHYDLGKLILNEIGVELQNPNEQEGVYYLHGINVDFPYDFIEYQVKEKDIIELKKQNTGDLVK